MDLQEAQKIDSLEGKISRIEVFIPDGPLKDDIITKTRARLSDWAQSSEFIVESAEDQKSYNRNELRIQIESHHSFLSSSNGWNLFHLTIYGSFNH